MIIDLQKAIAFYEMRGEIYRLLTLYYCTDELDAVNDRKAKELINKIEALDKKEKE